MDGRDTRNKSECKQFDHDKLGLTFVFGNDAKAARRRGESARGALLSVIPEWRISGISGTQGREASAETLALGRGSRADARGRDDR